MPKAFHEYQGLTWCKFHSRWFTSASHVDLGIVTLGVGARLMQLANERGRQVDGSGLLVNGAGRPLSLQAMAREAHATTEQVEAAIGELMEVGTMDTVGEFLSFPNLQQWQEDPSAERVRRHRAKRDGNVTDNVTVTPDVTHRGSEDQRTEEEKREMSTSVDPADEDVGQVLSLVPEEPKPTLARYVDAWNAGLDAAEEDLGRSTVVKRSKRGRPPSALQKATKAYPDPKSWCWCAYALAISAKATMEDAYKDYGLKWTAELSAKRLTSHMEAGDEARAAGRSKVKAPPPRNNGRPVPFAPKFTPAQGPQLESRDDAA